ncbi:TetR/AcrR family transcriptional regulator [Evansella sp. LMS18]|jgi:AcrR family transcriptional regulator|uniref:TetR/AcrR family transcriptional regulator n=1 Tax=Evansella sp. LMS18 TaxID=2924033 RepID=UPI0020D0ACA1|nr:TetR/AcrR family transcriptional regulator [Evansella sp. LMS18]UTR10752.1 TetR/AcrR family transcriptional regulator [Evansella sp. LMS18]
MPPKKKFSKEQIINAAFVIAKKEGIESITIRKVAEQMESSIAPIYVNFDNVQELKQEVVKKVVKLSQHLIKEQNTGSPFGDIGMASLQLAKEYPVLTRDFVLNQNDYLKDYDQEIASDLVDIMKSDPALEGLSRDELQNILLKMRTFQIGLVVMVTNGLLPEGFNLEKMKELSDSMAQDVITAAHSRKENNN